jgi:tRNA (guanine37-N1)-methyltransferase
MTSARGLRVQLFTLFPELLECAFSHSILKRAVEKGLFSPRIVNLRDFTRDRHRTADDKPYGGGSGMVMKLEPIARALRAARRGGDLGRVYLLSPAGRKLDQALAADLSRAGRFALICGRYEGVDERVAEHLCDGMISIGDYVLSGGEPAAVVVVEAAVRLVPGVLGDDRSAAEDSFSDGLLDFPHYTRPLKYRTWAVPEVLRSGDHRRIARWRRQQQLARTHRWRPDLLDRMDLDAGDRELLQEWLDQHPEKERKAGGHSA